MTLTTTVTTEPVRMSALRRHERFTGPDGQIYRVTADSTQHERGRVYVWNESMTPAEAAARHAAGGYEGADPRAGFYAYSTDPQVLRHLAA